MLTIMNQKSFDFDEKCNRFCIMLSDRCQRVGIQGPHFCSLRRTSCAILPDNCIPLLQALHSWPRTMQRQLGTGKGLIQWAAASQGDVQTMATLRNLPFRVYHLSIKGKWKSEKKQKWEWKSKKKQKWERGSREWEGKEKGKFVVLFF